MQQKQINCFGRLHSFIHYSLDWSVGRGKRIRNGFQEMRANASNKNCVYLANSMAHPWRINTHTLTARLLKDRMQKKRLTFHSRNNRVEEKMP